jgi:hypothetical protein
MRMGSMRGTASGVLATPAGGLAGGPSGPRLLAQAPRRAIVAKAKAKAGARARAGACSPCDAVAGVPRCTLSFDGHRGCAMQAIHGADGWCVAACIGSGPWLQADAVCG